MFKRLIVRLFLRSEINALKIRLAEASYALTKIELLIARLPQGIGPETVKLASEVLAAVLGSSDRIRSKTEGFTHAWQQAAYESYEAGKDGDLATYRYAIDLIERTKPIF